jgi:hypothetical protein
VWTSRDRRAAHGHHRSSVANHSPAGGDTNRFSTDRSPANSYACADHDANGITPNSHARTDKVANLLGTGGHACHT